MGLRQVSNTHKQIFNAQHAKMQAQFAIYRFPLRTQVGAAPRCRISTISLSLSLSLSYRERISPEAMQVINFSGHQRAAVPHGLKTSSVFYDSLTAVVSAAESGVDCRLCLSVRTFSHFPQPYWEILSFSVLLSRIRRLPPSRGVCVCLK